MLHAPYQNGAADPGHFSLLSFKADDHELQNPVLTNKKRNILKRAKQINTIFLETSDDDELLKVIPDTSTCEIENREEKNVFAGKCENEAEELYNTEMDTVINVTTPNGNSLMNTTSIPVSSDASPRSCDASELNGAAPSPKPCDISLPVSTTATPGLGDLSCVGSTQATDDQESIDDNDQQYICGTTSSIISRSTTIHEFEESHSGHDGHQNKNEGKREDESTGLSTLIGTTNMSHVEYGCTFGSGQVESPHCCNDKAISKIDSVKAENDFDQKYQNLELGSQPNNALLQV